MCDAGGVLPSLHHDAASLLTHHPDWLQVVLWAFHALHDVHQAWQGEQGDRVGFDAGDEAHRCKLCDDGTVVGALKV